MRNNGLQIQIEALTPLGLSEVQALLYLTSLKHGMLSVLELSRLTHINRQRIYEEIEKLVELGLYDITRKQRRKYIPAAPAKLIAIGKQKVATTERVVAKLADFLPSLEALAIPRKRRIVIKYYEGLEKIREAYESELEGSNNMEVLSFAGSIDDIFQFFPESYWGKWNKQFVKQGSRSRMLAHNSKAARDTAHYDRQYNRETRYLNNFPLKVNIDIFGNVAFIVSLHDEIGIWIESPIVAQSYRIVFNALWDIAQPFTE